jgi:acetyl-CoA acetyltransferase
MDEGLGVWEHRGKVAVVGVGHTPIDRRWDERPETSLGAYSMIAAQKAMDDAGISLDDIDGVVSCPRANIPEWSRPELPPPYNTADGVSKVTAEWLITNMGLNNVKFIDNTPDSLGGNISWALNFAAQAVGDGKAEVVLVRYTMGNFSGRYSQAGSNSEEEASGGGQWTGPWGWGAAGTPYAYLMGEYCRKYGSNPDRMAPFVVNARRNGRMFPDGYYYQHPEEALTVEDYLASRWIAKPLRIHDCDRPVQGGACYIVTTAERAKDMKQPPVYFLNHCVNKFDSRSSVETLDEVEGWMDSLQKKIYEGSGLTPRDIDVYNPYDGFTHFTQYYLEAMQWHGVKRGEAHDFYAGDISVEGPHPLLPSGGNNGTGRTRCAIYTDCIQQLRGQAGERQIRLKAETALGGETTPGSSAWTVFGKNPD